MTLASQLPDGAHASAGPSSFITRLTTALRPLLLAAPPRCRDDLQAAVAAVVSMHVDALADGGFRLDDCVSRLRSVGADWAVARHPVDHLLDMLNTLTEKTADIAVSALPDDRPDLRDAVEADVFETSKVSIAAVLAGYQESRQWKPRKVLSPHDSRALATALLWGLRVDPAHECALADGYAVIAVGRQDDDEPSPLPDRVHPSLSIVPAGRLDYLVTPAADRGAARARADELHGQLIRPAWMAVVWRSRSDVPSGRREVHDTVTIAVASNRPPDVYGLDDILVEYAVLQEESVVDNLIDSIAPLMDQFPLVRALEALLAANGNRSKAALSLDIHRSTLDYHLSRVEDLTGWRPTCPRDLENLAIALTTYAVVNSRETQTPPAVVLA
ncbi:PucR family transcriptional regulator [Saccharothrix deserti]|uniref:PucR family transcriptional regulator n=1 Tax=Saccharothrix deserti TaxID=2593674 RepID=UPI00131E5A71|nr:PucR family transcriptional regulator [Saccharothrix deserti]